MALKPIAAFVLLCAACSPAPPEPDKHRECVDLATGERFLYWTSTRVKITEPSSYRLTGDMGWDRFYDSDDRRFRCRTIGTARKAEQ